MTRPIIPRDSVARELSVSPRMLLRYEELGLVRVARAGPEEGYEPAQIRRLWTIVSFQRDLGVNLAGIEVILRLFDQLAEVHRRVGGLAEELRETLEASRDLDESPTAPTTDG
jgi:MerR family transcriptional regulator/heat shock protein HspR